MKIINAFERRKLCARTIQIQLQKTIPGLKNTALKLGQPEWVEEVAKIVGTKIDEVITIAKGKRGIAWFSRGAEGHAWSRHGLGEELLVKDITTFFPAGQTVTINGKTYTMLNKMSRPDIKTIFEDVVNSGVVPKDVGKYVYKTNYNRFGLTEVEVVTSKLGESITITPLKGEGLLRYNKGIDKVQKFTNEEWITIG